MRLGVLGPLEVETDAGDRLVVAAPKQRTLLACLALRANLTVSTGALMEAVWPDRKPVNAKPAILNYVARLRRNLLGVADRLQTTAGGYRLEVRDDAELDHLRAATLETRARKAVCGGDWRSGERHADAALALWRGEPLEDVPCERLRADWVPSFDLLQLRLEEVRLDALLSGAYLDRALPRLMDLTVAHPLLEPMYERAMVALYGTGRRAEALSCYGRARRALRDGIGADPSPCLRELHGLVLRDAPLSELMAVWDQARTLARSGGRSVARAKAAAARTGRVPSRAGASAAGTARAAARTVTGPVAPARDGLTEGAQGDPPGGPSAGFPLSQLPRPPQLVVGREQELRELTRLLAPPAPLPEAAAAPLASRIGDGPIATCALDAGAGVRVATVVGPAGVGKTTLALAWAHSIAERFPDGQMYLDLNGFTAEGRPVATDGAVDALLDFLGVPATRLPATPEGRAALYRGLVADKRLLVVFDNVRDATQVRPLLPSGKDCRALVTSRRSLGSLVALEGAEALVLAPLSADASHRLLVRRLGARRTSGQGQAIEAIAERCAHLPLALSVAADRAAVSATPLSTLADQLDRGALNALSAGDDASSVRSVLSWSYVGLTESAARVFRFLGLHPGTELTAAAAAAVADVPLAEAVPLVDELAAMSLLTERAPGRYTMHSLLRAFAVELVDDAADAREQQAARHRLYDYYLRWALAADRSCSALSADIEPDHVPLPASLTPAGFADRDTALAWLADEQQVLTTLIAQAAARGLNSYAWRLAAAQSYGLALRGGRPEELRQARAALAAAKLLGDPIAQGYCYLLIGRTLTSVGEYQTARFQLRRALRMFRAAGATEYLGEVHRVLGQCAYRQGEHREFARHAREHLTAAGHSGRQDEICYALNDLGWALIQCGEYREAHVHCLESLAMARDLGRSQQEAWTLDALGRIHWKLGDLETAAVYYRNAFDLIRRLREPLDVDYRLARAELLAANGRLDSARDIWLDVSLRARSENPTRAEHAERRLAEYEPTTADGADGHRVPAMSRR
ncbi:BTAD domain-containing putative transcriptional regulator [Kitasatospora sp. NPDC004669]|uniref:AfsR/SARP family transcriptional regulator n=1 Tax=Kitasatospora sp. NPDC004669 TaxID=3154555 RepID=UPI0033AAD099